MSTEAPAPYRAPRSSEDAFWTALEGCEPGKRGWSHRLVRQLAASGAPAILAWRDELLHQLERYPERPGGPWYWSDGLADEACGEILRGRRAFEDSLRDPTTTVGDDGEELLHVVGRAFEAATGSGRLPGHDPLAWSPGDEDPGPVPVPERPASASGLELEVFFFGNGDEDMAEFTAAASTVEDVVEAAHRRWPAHWPEPDAFSEHGVVVLALEIAYGPYNMGQVPDMRWKFRRPKGTLQHWLRPSEWRAYGDSPAERADGLMRHALDQGARVLARRRKSS